MTIMHINKYIVLLYAIYILNLYCYCSFINIDNNTIKDLDSIALEIFNNTSNTNINECLVDAKPLDTNIGNKLHHYNNSSIRIVVPSKNKINLKLHGSGNVYFVDLWHNKMSKEITSLDVGSAQSNIIFPIGVKNNYSLEYNCFDKNLTNIHCYLRCAYRDLMVYIVIDNENNQFLKNETIEEFFKDIKVSDCTPDGRHNEDNVLNYPLFRFEFKDIFKAISGDSSVLKSKITTKEELKNDYSLRCTEKNQKCQNYVTFSKQELTDQPETAHNSQDHQCANNDNLKTYRNI